MLIDRDRLIQDGCNKEKEQKICRTRGGESCAFDGAMIVLQPIADAVHLVHGPIACCGNSWEGRGTLSARGNLHRMGFTTDMRKMDIVYGSDEKLYQAILRSFETFGPKAVFVYATCISGLIGDDIESVCGRAQAALGIPVVPVIAPGFVGPKNLGNRIAGEVLLDRVIGTGEPEFTTAADINLIGEYNIAGDLWLIEPVLKRAGIRVLSRITGNSTFGEITYAHRAGLNVVVCSRALINIAAGMGRRYGIPYIEVSFFGRTEMSKALRLISSGLASLAGPGLNERVESVIQREEKNLEGRLKEYSTLRGKKAVLYTGGVKSWSFISALRDLGMEVVAVGTKKSTFEDEEKIKVLLDDPDAVVEDVTPGNLRRLMRDRHADILIAGGRNQYLAAKEGFPFVDVNQERHSAYAGYEGLINLAEQINASINFYRGNSPGLPGARRGQSEAGSTYPVRSMDGKESAAGENRRSEVLIDPLNHSQALGAAVAFQGIHKALPVIHGAQGCSFLAKVLLTKHFREPIALASTKLFTEDVVMGGEQHISKVVGILLQKNTPEVVGILSSGLAEVKGDDIESSIRHMRTLYPDCNIVHVSTPDYEGGFETGYAKATEAIIGFARHDGGEGSESGNEVRAKSAGGRQINILAGAHLTPADHRELREIAGSFGLKPVLFPDLSALDGSRLGFSALAVGGAQAAEIRSAGSSEFTIAIGASMEGPAALLERRFGTEYRLFESVAGLEDTDSFMKALSELSGRPVPSRYSRQRLILIDGMRDASPYCGGKKVCLALETDLSIQISRLFTEVGTDIGLAVLPVSTAYPEKILARETRSGGLFSIGGEFDILISNSHASAVAEKLNVPLYQMGFPMYKILGNTSKITIGYAGSLTVINEVASLLMNGAS